MPEAILGYPTGIVIMWGAGLVYLIGVLAFIKPFIQEKNVLITSFFSFLLSMGLANIFMGFGMYTMKPIFMYLGLFSVFTGSAFILKFPLTALKEPLRKPLFYSSLIISWALVALLMILPFGRDIMPQFTIWFMVIVNGAISGFYMIWVGLRAKFGWLKIRAIGGGLGIASCCLASHLFFVSTLGAGALLSAVFQFISPIIILFSVYYGRYLQNRTKNSNTSTA